MQERGSRDWGEKKEAKHDKKNILSAEAWDCHFRSVFSSLYINSSKKNDCRNKCLNLGKDFLMPQQQIRLPLSFVETCLTPVRYVAYTHHVNLLNFHVDT